MTERKPRAMSWTTWIDQQIDEAKERGAFDNLPGAGKPLPDRGDEDFGQSWLREWVQREGVTIDEMLPPPLKLRKKAALLAERAPGMRGEQDVRDAVTGLNKQIMDWRRIPVGPPIFVPLVDEEKMVGLWRDAHPVTPPPGEPADAAADAGPRAGDAGRSRRSRWRRRRQAR
jgi:DnaJ-like protein